MSSLYANLDRARPYVLSLFRILVALLFVAHGTAKLFGFPAAGPSLTPLLTAQAIIEFAGGILLAFGVYTRFVAFILSGDMAVAYFLAHFPKSFFPSANGGDAAVLYCFIFFYLCIAGAGPVSLDALFFKKSG